MDQNQINQDVQAKLAKLRRDLDDLSANFYKNNFSSHQDFNKSSSFNTALKVPSYDTLPTCEVGQIAESSGKLYICSATDVWTIVGTQS